MIFRAKGVLKRSKPRFTVSEWFSRSWEHEEAWSSRHEKWSGDVLVQEIGTGYNDMDARGLAEVRCSHRFESSRLTTMFRPTQRIGSGRNQGPKGPIPSGMTESKSGREFRRHHEGDRQTSDQSRRILVAGRVGRRSCRLRRSLPAERANSYILLLDLEA